MREITNETVNDLVNPPILAVNSQELSASTKTMDPEVTEVAASRSHPIRQNRAIKKFPAGFLWGAATAAYQIEGASTEDGRGESIWDRFSHTPGKTLNGDTGDIADDFYHLYEHDLDLIQELGLKIFRFSIAWPRIIPTGEGAVNQKGVDFYKRLVAALNQRGIIPMATLYHWDLPQALEDKGGWLNRETAYRFAEYADVMFKALGHDVPLWLTLNEPKTVVDVGYKAGIHAPGFQDPAKAHQAMHHLLLGHGLAVQAFHKNKLPNSQIGIALNLATVYPAPNEDVAPELLQLQDGYQNTLYLDSVLKGSYPQDVLADINKYSNTSAYILPGDLAIINQPLDCLAVNYYNSVSLNAAGELVNVHPTTSASWAQVHPRSIYDMLVRVKRDYGDIPLYITESGAAYEDVLNEQGQVNDPKRIQYLNDYLTETQNAIADGVNLKGHCVWSLLDNFEWGEGYSQRWGIIYVDYATQKRYPKRSAYWYKEVVRQNGIGPLPQDMLTKL